ncbi:hypothetical protein OED52_10360 [Rhodococcus sp. Z13]|uniref:Uncharacterized protein n=1 Tax=Rhodococcus sacchari TaxID=2962047 RepID=A0ACD4DMB9_9NOCA|nr:hypothetical protein [Rhodococcus sp. Z13]UYP20878.1 hypothetical protein OED52_10360 [Rhodococcus sp. Z13]
MTSQHEVSCREANIIGDEALLSAMAVGLVENVWRNGPVEAMHGSKRGPTDTMMFAESTALHVHAVRALSSQERAYGLLDFEKHLLDRKRPWACSGGRALRELGYGQLGNYTKHVRRHTNLLIHLDEHTCVDDALQSYLVFQALRTGAHHKGMPEWPRIVDRIGILLADSEHPAWPDKDRGLVARASLPDSVVSIEEMQRALLEDPSQLPCDILEWLTQFFLYSAGPPFHLIWNNSV